MTTPWRSSYQWKKKRREISKLYGERCALCGSDENCQVHHIVPIAILPELKLDNNNLILLCSSCHTAVHNGLISQTKLKSITKAHT